LRVWAAPEWFSFLQRRAFRRVKNSRSA